MASQLIKIGDQARDFSLRDQHNDEFSLSEHKGNKILLSFHPLAWTSVCSRQMMALEAHYKIFAELNVLPIGLSIDAVPAKNFWAKTLYLKDLRILSDFWPHGNIAKLYGVFREKEGFSERANILIGEDQTIKFVKIYDIPQLPDIGEVLDACRK